MALPDEFQKLHDGLDAYRINIVGLNHLSNDDLYKESDVLHAFKQNAGYLMSRCRDNLPHEVYDAIRRKRNDAAKRHDKIVKELNDRRYRAGLAARYEKAITDVLPADLALAVFKRFKENGG